MKNVPPWLAGLIRAVVLAILGAVVAYLSANQLPGQYAVYTGIVIVILRELEALLDQTVKPNQNSVPGGPGTPSGSSRPRRR